MNIEKYLMGAAVLGILVTGCKNGDVVKQKDSSLLSVKACYGTDSRTAVANGQTVWKASDEVYVTSEDGKCFGILRLDDGEDTSVGMFSGYVSGDPSELDYSVFPVPTNGVIDLTTRKDGNPDAPMIATFGASGQTLSFDITCGMVAIKINGAQGKSVTLTYGGMALGGTAEVVYNPTTKKYELAYTRAGNGGGVTVTGIQGNATMVYIPVVTSDKEGDRIPNTGNINLKVRIGEAETIINVPVVEGKVSLEQVPEITYDAVEDEIKKEGTVIPDVKKSPEEALREAMESDDKVVTLSTNVELFSPLLVTKAKVLDLAGFTIKNGNEFTGTEEALIVVSEGGSLTINDSGENGGVVVEDNGAIYSAIKMTASNEGPEAVLKVNGGNIQGTGCGIFQPQEGYMEINGGVVTGSQSAVEIQAGRMVMNGGKLICGTDFNDPEANNDGATMRGGVALGVTRNSTGNDVEVRISGGELEVLQNSAEKTNYGIYEYSQPGTTGKVEIHLKDYPKSLEAESAALYCEVTDDEYLQNAVNFKAPSIEVDLMNDIEGDVVAVQKEGVNIVIDGNKYRYDGTIYIDGDNRAEGNEKIELTNINFETAVDRVFVTYASNTEPGSHGSTYPHNVTISDCDFKAVISGTTYNERISGINFNQMYNIKIENCTALNMHSLLQAQSCDNIVVVDKVTVTNCKNGVSFGNTAYPSISNSTINSVGESGYGVRCDGNNSRGELRVEGCNVSGENPIVVRKMTTSYSVEFFGENSISAGNEKGYQVIFTNGDDGTFVNPTGTFSIFGAEKFKLYPGGGE